MPTERVTDAVDHADVAQILYCPITKGALRRLAADELAALNARIATGSLRHHDGTPVTREVVAGFISADGRCAYRVDDDIIDALSHHAIVVCGPATRHDQEESTPRPEKTTVQRFYDEYGWTKNAGDDFADASEYEDLRPVSQPYRHACHMRVRRFLAPAGRYLLDVGSGPLQYPEYLSYSESYRRRICVDTSRRALLEARKKLGEKGVYVLADVTNLPVRDESVDAVVCLHTLYHVPENEQDTGLRELQRVLKRGRSGVVVYSWGNESPLMKLCLLRFRALRPLRRRLRWRLARLRSSFAKARPAKPARAAPSLYFHAHPYRWWVQRRWGFRLEIRTWRSVRVDFLQRYVHRWLLGKALLRLVYWLEERFPHVMGRLGQYPMFVLHK